MVRSGLKWNHSEARPGMVITATDLFAPDVNDAYIFHVFTVISTIPDLVFSLRTNHAERMNMLINLFCGPDLPNFNYARADAGLPDLTGEHPGANIWLGVNIGSEDDADRARQLEATPAAVRAIHFDRLTGPVDQVPLDGIDWVTANGDTADGEPEPKELWFHQIAGRCAQRGTAFYMRHLPGRFELNDLPEPLRIRQYPDTKPGK